MKIPTWFVIGCGLLVLNLILVLGGTLSRHASAVPPGETQKSDDQQPNSDTLSLSDDERPDEPTLPKVPSLEIGAPYLENNNLPSQNAPMSMPSIVSLEEVKNAADELRPSLSGPMDSIMKASPTQVSEQLSHSFFESMKLRLKTVEHLNQSAIGLVDEAAVLYQRGEVAEAQKLLGVATQLRETTARLLVTHQ